MIAETVALCADGAISPPVALARMVLAGFGPDEIAPQLPHGSELARLCAAERGRLTDLANMLRASGATHTDGTVATIAAMFDRAVALAPEASVAAYTLGDGARLAAATDELVAWLFGQGLANADGDVLDLGCGIGRVAAALAPHVRSVLGTDVSAGMIAEARRRCSAPNVRFAETDGTPPAAPATGGFDLVLAVDSMPYVVQAGIAEATVAACRRLLRPGGALAVFNLSYRGDPEADEAEARRWAAHAAYRLTLCGARPFRLWDGAAYVFMADG